MVFGLTASGTDLLAALLDEARSDARTVGLMLTGSRASGTASARDDYDVYWVVTDASFERMDSTTERRASLGIVYLSPSLLREMAGARGWWTYSLASAEILLDKGDTLRKIVDELKDIPAAYADELAAEAYQDYLHSFVRSMRSHARGDELGARLHAAESLTALARVLFALERRWVPYHDRLHVELDTIAQEGWPAGYLRDVFTQIAASADPEPQADLERRVESLLEAQGMFHHRQWGERLRRFT
jgi:predicted nucleotidyltransferase